MKTISIEPSRAWLENRLVSCSKFLCAGLPLLTALGLWAMASGRVPPNRQSDSISAKAFHLTDGQGRRRAALNTVKGTVGLSMWDQEGQSRLDILVEEKGEPVIWLLDRASTAGAELSLTLGQYAEISCLGPFVPGERAMLGLNHEGIGYLSIWEASKNDFWVVPPSKPAPAK